MVVSNRSGMVAALLVAAGWLSAGEAWAQCQHGMGGGGGGMAMMQRGGGPAMMHGGPMLPEHLITHGVLALLGCLVILAVSQWVFTRLENKIPERL